MDGPSFVALVEKELKSRGIAKAEFYSATGISSATFSQWRNGLYAPSSTNIKKVEGFLGIRFDFSILLDAARDAAAKKAPAADTGDERDPVTQEIFDFIDHSNKKELDEVHRYIQFLKSQRPNNGGQT